MGRSLTLLPSFPLRTLPLPFPLPLPFTLLLPQKTRSVPYHRRLERQGTRQHVPPAVARSAKTPLGVETRRARQQRIGHEPRRQGGNGRLDVIVAAAEGTAVIRVVVAWWVRSGEGVWRALGAGAEDGTGAGRGRREYDAGGVGCFCAGFGGGFGGCAT